MKAKRSLTALLLATTSFGCTSIPEGRRAVTGFDVKGNESVDQDDLEAKLATRKTSKFLMLFRGVVYEYEVYDRYALERDLARIERYYRARGYYDAKVRVARVHDDGDDKVEIEVQLDEGEPVRIRHITIEWTEAVPERVRRVSEKETRRTANAKHKLFDEDQIVEAEKALTKTLADNGYAAAATTHEAEVDVVRREAVVKFRVTPGEPSVFGAVSFEGLGEIPEAPVRRAFAIEPGADYSASALEDGRQALLDLGVFSNVDVVPDLANEQREAGRGRRIVPVKVQVSVGKLRTLRLGGGFEISSLRTDTHALIGWSNQNTFGDLRRVELTFRPGLVFYPLAIGRLNDGVQAILPMQRTRGTLTRPSFIEGRTTLEITGRYDIGPYIFARTTENVIGYHEVGATASLKRPFGHYIARPGYGFQAAFPYDAIGRSPQSLDPVTVSYVEYHSYFDLRNDPLRPMRGAYFASTLQYAGGLLSGSADDVRIQPEARGYIPLAKNVSIGVRIGFGFLFPRNYANASQQRFGDPATAAAVDRRRLSRDYQILAFRGFTSGGASSNRGYPVYGISPYDGIPYVVPDVSRRRGLIGCNPNDPNPPKECQLPTGGLTQWESSLELRFNVSGPFLAATFCDAADVSPYPLGGTGPAIRLRRPHLSCGAGARLDTPAGPIRLDVGYRIPGLQILKGEVAEGENLQPELFGLPVALAFGIGEAF